MKFPFEVPFEEVQANLDAYIDEVFGSLSSAFLTMPKGQGFIEYSTFAHGYEALKRATGGFRNLSPEAVFETVCCLPVTFVVLRAMLGFTPPEWAYMTTQRTGVEVPQGAARTLDRTVRMKPLTPMPAKGGVTERRLRALVTTACQLLTEGAQQAPGILHRLDKADTREGLASLQPVADLGVPYAMVLYERRLQFGRRSPALAVPAPHSGRGPPDR